MPSTRFHDLSVRTLEAGHGLLWRHTATPDFLIVGAQKAGTTSLYRYLARLPSVRRVTRKEIHYFDDGYAHGPAWYARHFPLDLGADRSWLVGEASPYYLRHPHAPARVAADAPNAKIIVLVRNPVDRAYSQWAMNRRIRDDGRTFEESLAAEESGFPAAHEALLRDPTRVDDRHRAESFVARGRYAEQLTAWEEHIPRERIAVVVSERLFTQPARELAAVHAFLGIERAPVEFPWLLSASYDEMDPATRARLEETFTEPNRALSERLGIDLREHGWSG